MDVDQLIHRAQAGDLEARDQLGYWITAKLSRFFGNCFREQDAADLIQKVAEVILKNLHTFELRGPGSFDRYVGRVAGIQARSNQRDGSRAGVRQAKLETHVVTPELSPSSQILEQEQRALLMRWIPKLPDIHRRALEHWLAGGDDETFALREGIAVSTARSRRRYARKLLKDLIEQARLTPFALRSPSTE